MFSLKHIVSVRDLTREQILELLDCAILKIPPILNRKFVRIFPADYEVTPGFISVMLQPSTGTAVSMDAAAYRVGCSHPTAAIREVMSTSHKKGERLKHLVRRLYLQAGINFFSIRGPYEGLTKALAFNFDQKHSPQTMLGNDITFLNAGEGERYHPTQILLDLLGWVIWKLFGEAILADGQYRVSHPKFLGAVEEYCKLNKKNRLQKIVEAIDGTTWCIAGDLGKSRIVFDMLSLGEKDESGKPKFVIHFLLVAPEFAQVDPRYLQGISHGTHNVLNPDLPADIFYRFRWRKEHRAPQFHEAIQRFDAQYRVSWGFLEHCRTREKQGPAFFYDALPIDKWNPSIEDNAEDHPNVLCWLEAWSAPALRMAGIEKAYECWRSEEMAEESVWQLPEPVSTGLLEIDRRSLSEHQEDYRRRRKKSRQDHVNLIENGSNLDHLPSGMAIFIKQLLRSLGYKGNIITSDEAFPPDRPDDTRDIMWFPDRQLHQWKPEILDVVGFFTEGQMTYNVFDQAEDVKVKMKVDPHAKSLVVGVFRCPRGVNSEGDEPECIDGHPEEIRTSSIIMLYEQGGVMVARCDYCNSIHTPTEMLKRLKATLPAA